MSLLAVFKFWLQYFLKNIFAVTFCRSLSSIVTNFFFC